MLEFILFVLLIVTWFLLSAGVKHSRIAFDLAVIFALIFLLFGDSFNV